MARRISPHSLGHHRCLARGGEAIRHSAGEGLQHRRQRGLLLFPRQPEAWAALVGGARVPQADLAPAKLAAGNRLPGRRPDVRRQARRRRALAAGWRCELGPLPRRDHHGGRLDRLAANHDAVGRGTCGAACAVQHSRAARQTGRRRQPARPSATADDLQSDWHQDAERNVFVATGARMDGRRICLVPARAFDHGTVAARRLHQIRSHVRSRQSAVSHPAAVARQVRRSAASVSGLYDQRHQCAANEPRRAHAQIRRSSAAAGHRAKLSIDAGRPPRRCRFYPRDPQNCGAAGATAIFAGRISPGPAGARRRRGRAG